MGMPRLQMLIDILIVNPKISKHEYVIMVAYNAFYNIETVFHA